VKKTFSLRVCFCGHLEEIHELQLETYYMCRACHELGLLRKGFIHDFKLDNLRCLEAMARED